ncbi:MAG: 3-dehydroquinate synthase/shikimate kinase / 3-dehydroquinate synthase [Pelagibacterales bacterium]|jgi:3-dehydroquinate synthase|nr:3-dehydroquinate synthase/shikimate kinase / 3-dehydroquinate synthase [Pelagibacterales bacterium]
MKTQEIKFQNLDNNYSILIGNNILHLLKNKIKSICPKTKKIALVFDKNVPKKYKNIILKELHEYELISYNFNASEKTKSLTTAIFYLNKLLSNNFNRTDLVIGVGGGITGDLIGFVASIFKRGINFMSVPTTLLSQVDAAIGGKTGVNSNFGKNLIGSFSQPKLVISDTSFLKSLPRKEIICGYAEILKHAVIYNNVFFNWLKLNTKHIFSLRSKELIYAIQKSCKIKLFFVNKDVDEKNLRMVLNFGHTFGHAIEVKNNYSKNITHGEAVLAGMIFAAKLSVIKKVCTIKTLNDLLEIYKMNNLSYTFKKYLNSREINALISYLKNDKKNNDKKINFILLKKIGRTALPNKHKISIKELKKYTNLLVNTNF